MSFKFVVLKCKYIYYVCVTVTNIVVFVNIVPKFRFLWRKSLIRLSHRKTLKDDLLTILLITLQIFDNFQVFEFSPK